MTELRDLILMLTSVGILIAFGDWLYRNMPDALDYRSGNLSDGDDTQAAPGFDLGGKVNPSAAETRTDKGDTAHRDLGPSR